MRNNRLVLNGRPADYAPLDPGIARRTPSMERPNHTFAEETLASESHPIMVTPERPAPRSFASLRVPNGQYLVLGDNRDNSADSRYFGLVDRKMIVGKAPAVVVSFDRDNFYLPRRNRWFKRLP